MTKLGTLAIVGFAFIAAGNTLAIASEATQYDAPEQQSSGFILAQGHVTLQRGAPAVLVTGALSAQPGEAPFWAARDEIVAGSAD